MVRFEQANEKLKY